MIDEASLSSRYLGRIVQNQGRPLIISPGKRRLFGYVAEAVLDQVRDGMSVVAEGPEGAMKLVCRVRKLQSYPQASSIVFRATSEFVTEVELEPLGQIDGRAILPVPNGDFHGYGFRCGTSDEMATFYQIPAQGLRCGDLAMDGSETGLSFRLPVEILYRSLFICGAKGSGKTTCLRSILPRSLDPNTGASLPPAIVILDVEGEFSDPSSTELFKGTGGRISVDRISTDSSVASTTLGLGQVHYEHFANFAPNLPLNSMLHLESIIKELSFRYKERGLVPRAPEILRDIQQAAWRRPGIHHFQRDALVRATMSDVFAMFDQDGLQPLVPELLVRPGWVSVLDVSTLTDDQQRVAALYLLSSLSVYKNRSLDSTGLLLVMDEAQKLFPQKGDLKQEYAERLGKFVSHIVHRGRRRRYGIILSTQYPADVSRDVVDLCDTKFMFRMSGPQAWLRMILGDTDRARQAAELSVGEAFVTSNGLNLPEPVRIRFPAAQRFGDAEGQNRPKLLERHADAN